MKMNALTLTVLTACGFLGVARAATVSVSNVRASQDTNTLMVTVMYDLKVEGATKNLPYVSVKLTDELGQEIASTWKGHVGAVGSALGHVVCWDPFSNGCDTYSGTAFATVTATLPDEKSVEMKMAAIPGFTKTYYRMWLEDSWPEPTWSYSAHDSFNGAETCSFEVKPFWMDVTEVTYAMWKKVVAWGEEHGYDFTPSMLASPYAKGYQDNHPVIYVGPGLATLWCNARSEMEGKTPLYYRDGEVFRKEASKYWKCTCVEPADGTKAGYRLPTCYEWSFAAHGGLSCKYPWGDDFNLEMMNCPYPQESKGRHPVWGYVGYQPYTSPAGSFPANGYGLCDMVGNVWEMCESACITADGNGLYVSPGKEKCYLGGSWSTYSEGCEDHAYSGMSNIEANSGFRTVCLSSPSAADTGSKSSARSNLFLLDVCPPKIISWNVYGDKTDHPKDRNVSGCTDPYLVAGSNLIVAVKFNAYDRKRFHLQTVRLSGEPMAKPAKHDIKYKWIGLSDSVNDHVLRDDTGLAIPAKRGYHGPYSFTLSARFSGYGTVGGTPEKVEKKVYFSREGYDNGLRDPNWFVYWREDGAVPALSSASGYSVSSAWHDFASGAEFIDLIHSGTDDKAWGQHDSKNRSIILHRRASDWHYWAYLDWKDSMTAVNTPHSLIAGGIQFACQYVYGIYTVENVLAHESQHRKDYLEYTSSSAVDTDKSSPDYCDRLTDDMEKHINSEYGARYGFMLETNDTDTLKLGVVKHESYKYSGDDEFVAMLAGATANADTHIHEEKDWAYPGHQSWLPGDSADNFVKLRSEEPDADKLITSKGAVSVKKVASSAKAASVGRADDAEFSVSNVTISAVVSRNGQTGKVSSIDYSFIGEFPSGQELDFVGYLADAQSNIVAVSSFTTDPDHGGSRYLMRFDANEICRSGHEGPYTLFGLIVDKLISVESVRVGAYVDLDVEPVRLSLSELERKSAWLIPSGCGESVSKDGLSVKLKLDVFEAGKYDVAVDLLTTNGDFVASQELTKECQVGTNQVKILFSPEVLLGAGYDGPYVVRTVQLLRNGEQIDACSDCLTTVAYKLTDFASAAFVSDEIVVSEGGKASVEICGGSSNETASVNVCLTHLTTDAADLGVKFASPMTISWEKGEVGLKQVEIPIATDATVEGDEFFVLQLADSQGQAVGSKSLCKVVVRDGNTRATLQDGAGYYKTQVATSGDGLWVASPGSFSEPDAESGLSHLESPALRHGQTSELTFGPLDAGQFCYHIRFTGNINAAEPSCVKVYVDDQYSGLFEHTSPSSSSYALSDTWEYYYATVAKTGSKVRFVFTQGSDPNSRAEICEVRWRLNADSVFGEVYALCGTAGGTVSGSGPYALGDTATLKATALPGYRFAGWKKYDDNLQLVAYGESPTETIKVTGNFRIYAFFESIPYVAGLSLTGTGGTVSGSGYCADGQKVTLKAEAGTGYVLDGWYTNGVFTTACTSVIVDRSARPGASTQTQCVIRDVTEDIVFYAKFVAQTSDVAAVTFALPEEMANGVAIANVAVNVSGSMTLPTVKVTGLPTGLKFAAKDILKKGSKTEVEYPANTIYGTPTKSGVYTVVATVTTAGKKTASCSQTVVVRKSGENIVKVVVPDMDGAVPGKVIGAGICAAGKKVTLKATANKGYVFAGWWPWEAVVDAGGAAGVRALPEGDPISRAASYVIDKMPTNDVELFAAFITAETDKANIAAAVNGMAFSDRSDEDVASPLVTNIWAGVYLEWPVAASALSETTVKVAGLPSGLKFAAKDVTQKIGSGKTAQTIVVVPANTIYGAPSAASKVDKGGKVTPSQVKVTVTTAGKSSQTYQIDTTVDPLPAWAQGPFAGGWTSDEDRARASGGQVSLTVSAAGKVSGKATGDGLAYALAAPYYSGFAAMSGEEGVVSNFWADLTASWSYKDGSKTVKTNETARLFVRDNGIGGSAEVEGWFEAYTANWKVEPWKAIGKTFDKRTLAYLIMADGTFIDDATGSLASTELGDQVVGKVTLKFAASGTVIVSGEFAQLDASGQPIYKSNKLQMVKASGSATLVPATGDSYLVFVYLTPKGLSTHARCFCTSVQTRYY